MSSCIIEELCDEFVLERRDVEKIIDSAHKRYKVYQIPKRNGRGMRTIAQPTKEVKIFQRWFQAKYLDDLPIHPAAMAYRAGVSIASNAKRHLNARFMLKMDFKDFFPSIVPNDLLPRLRNKYKCFEDEEECRRVSSLLFWLPKKQTSLRLSIGAPTSPIISNIVMYQFDDIVAQICENMNVVYTRYADDICFSTDGKGVLVDIERKIKMICDNMASPNLTVNEDKTENLSKKFRRTVTGLNVTPDGKVSVGRERKRIISAKVKHFLEGSLSADESQKLKGEIAFCYSVEPTFVKSLKRKYGEWVVTRIQRLKRKENTQGDITDF